MAESSYLSHNEVDSEAGDHKTVQKRGWTSNPWILGAVTGVACGAVAGGIIGGIVYGVTK
ncbi:hypothetical protein CC79DRAFT_1332819 [Sarocladium strictum]